ncbi:hypothetical protein [Henriciella mobilis]|uniref:Uncharacterized protein n=1 Tax=Henriciella mobilis TaxID=2305467 RepID=A0A399R7B8_9PROT|nr:hypothetical protein [Henriciella mobilis]RIJ26381.1 hypothetical protein D1223_15445 [Henriciella mobilis]
MAQKFEPATYTTNYDFDGLELESFAANFIEVMQRCDEFVEIELYDCALECLLSNLSAVENKDSIAYPPSSIAHLWESDDEEDELDVMSRKAIEELEAQQQLQKSSSRDRTDEATRIPNRSFRFPEEVLLSHSAMLNAVKGRSVEFRVDDGFALKAARAGFPVNPIATMFSFLMPLSLIASLPVGWFFGWQFGLLCLAITPVAFVTAKRIIRRSIARSAWRSEEHYELLNDIGAVWLRATR